MMAKMCGTNFSNEVAQLIEQTKQQYACVEASAAQHRCSTLDKK
jgi:hypothetical protein